MKYLKTKEEERKTRKTSEINKGWIKNSQEKASKNLIKRHKTAFPFSSCTSTLNLVKVIKKTDIE